MPNVFPQTLKLRSAPAAGMSLVGQVAVSGQPQLFQVVGALGPPRRLARDWIAGSSKAIRIAMMAMTTNNSMSVKPRRVRMRFPLSGPQDLR